MERPLPHILWYPGHEVFVKDIVRAENCSLYDSKGRRYVDLESGVWCTVIGHGHPAILRVLQSQSALVGHTGYNYSNAIVEEAAREILSLLGFNDGGCVFLCSGSESVEYGVRVAQAIAKKPLLMTMTDSYFGAYGSASKRQENEWFSFDWLACAGCPDPKECDEHCERWAAVPFDRIGGFLLEPGSSSGLVRFPPDKLVRSIVRAVTKNDGLVLVNEVTTGIGRTGTWFGYQHYGISPHIVALGKGIGNGYPVSVTALSPRALELMGGTPIPFATSHQNDPLGAAIARAVIRVIREEGLITRGREIAATLATGLKGIKARTGKIKEIRERGLMLAFELDDDPQTSSSSRVQQELFRRGFFLAKRPGLNVLRIDPALTIEREDIDRFLKTLENVLEEAPACE